MKAVIIDDEKRSRLSLELILKELKPNVKVVGQADSVKMGIQTIKNCAPEIVFLDIKMPDGDAFDLLESLDECHFHLIFVTAYDNFALRAFEFSAIDYLVKPIDHDKLIRVFEKLDKYIDEPVSKDRLQILEKNIRSNDFQHIIIHSEREHVRLKVEDILRMEADGNYSHIFVMDGSQYLTSKNLKHYEKLLEDQFCRIHHSHLVNMHHVKRITSSPDNQVLLSNNEVLPVSFRKKKNLLAAFDRK